MAEGPAHVLVLVYVFGSHVPLRAAHRPAIPMIFLKRFLFVICCLWSAGFIAIAATDWNPSSPDFPIIMLYAVAPWAAWLAFKMLWKLSGSVIKAKYH